MISAFKNLCGIAVILCFLAIPSSVLAGGSQSRPNYKSNESHLFDQELTKLMRGILRNPPDPALCIHILSATNPTPEVAQLILGIIERRRLELRDADRQEHDEIQVRATASDLDYMDFIIAMRQANIERQRHLLRTRNFDLSRQIEGGTLLDYAVNPYNLVIDRPETIRLLVAAGANPNYISSPHPPLFYAIASNSEQNVRALLEMGANPNISVTLYGRLIFVAIDHYNLNAFKLLVAYGAERKVSLMGRTVDEYIQFAIDRLKQQIVQERAQGASQGMLDKLILELKNLIKMKNILKQNLPAGPCVAF